MNNRMFDRLVGTVVKDGEYAGVVSGVDYDEDGEVAYLMIQWVREGNLYPPEKHPFVNYESPVEIFDFETALSSAFNDDDYLPYVYWTVIENPEYIDRDNTWDDFQPLVEALTAKENPAGLFMLRAVIEYDGGDLPGDKELYNWLETVIPPNSHCDLIQGYCFDMLEERLRQAGKIGRP